MHECVCVYECADSCDMWKFASTSMKPREWHEMHSDQHNSGERNLLSCVRLYSWLRVTCWRMNMWMNLLFCKAKTIHWSEERYVREFYQVFFASVFKTFFTVIFLYAKSCSWCTQRWLTHLNPIFPTGVEVTQIRLALGCPPPRCPPPHHLVRRATQTQPQTHRAARSSQHRLSGRGEARKKTGRLMFFINLLIWFNLFFVTGWACMWIMCLWVCGSFSGSYHVGLLAWFIYLFVCRFIYFCVYFGGVWRKLGKNKSTWQKVST